MVGVEGEAAAAATAVEIRVLVIGGEAEVKAFVWWRRASRRRRERRSGRCSRPVRLSVLFGLLCCGGRIHAPVCGWGGRGGGRNGWANGLSFLGKERRTVLYYLFSAQFLLLPFLCVCVCARFSIPGKIHDAAREERRTTQCLSFSLSLVFSYVHDCFFISLLSLSSSSN